MHPLPPAHLSLRRIHNAASAMVAPKAISRPHPRLPALPREDSPPLIYWPPIALAGIVCLMLISSGVLFALGIGKRPAPQTEAQIDDASRAVAIEPDAGDPALPVHTPTAASLNDDANAAPASAPIVAASYTALVDATPLNPQPLALFADAAGDAQALAPPKAPAKAACKRYGTSVDFVDNPIDAAAQAQREKKLLFVLHVAGNFEEEKFT